VTGSAHVHVVGAGLAGLSAAVALVAAGRRVSLYEAGGHAGGRCRSYFDSELGCRIDNGNHLLLAGNRAAVSYLETIGAADTLVRQELTFPFLDLATGERWRLRPNSGRLPWWVVAPSRRVPGTRAGDYLGAVRLAVTRPDDVVTDRLDPQSVVFQRLWRPLAVAALNTEPEAGSARLLRQVLRESFGRGGAACRPLLPREGLSETFVDPALAYLARHGVTVRFGARLRRIDLAAETITGLDLDGETLPLAAEDALVLAVPAPVAARLVPGLLVPDQFRAIVNAHYRVDAPAGSPPFVGLVGGTAEWVFRKPGVLSVTVSAADRLADTAAETLAAMLWCDVVRAYGLGDAPLPPWRIVKEKRATFAATPAQERRRPAAATSRRNLFLAGDWTATRLPATIEGAIRSGQAAALAVLAPQTCARDAKEQHEPISVSPHGAPRTPA
jgi:squalene-associated FAD-dependent desaturase